MCVGVTCFFVDLLYLCLKKIVYVLFAVKNIN
jgi:hypothetical protein